MTTIKKNQKMAILSTNTLYSHDLNMPEELDNLAINDMVRDIEELDEESHEQIYLLLRSFKPQSFFTTDRGGGGTHFDRSLLTDKQTYELYRTVQLCKENLTRKHVVDNAKIEHEYNMSSCIK